MANAITNHGQFVSIAMGAANNAALSGFLADQTATTSTQNSGISTLTWAHIRVYVKTFGTLTAADTFRATLQVGTSTAITNPVNIAQANITVETGDVGIVFDLYGFVATGNFQSWKVIFTSASSHSFTADIEYNLG